MAMPKPIIIAGAGISGLLLAQHLRKQNIPFEIYERDGDMTTRGIGWGLTLHWSLPAIRAILPDELVARLPEAYVDVAAIQEGKQSLFPFFDLSTGELKASTPQAREADRIRVSRQRLRELLADGINIKWGMGVTHFSTNEEGVTVTLEDGTTTEGCLLVGCDGRNSRVRRQLFPELKLHPLPIRVLGAQLRCDPETIGPLRDRDPFFLQGNASQNDTFFYFSVLDAPGNKGNVDGKYNCQIVCSWPVREGFFGREKAVDGPGTSLGRIALVKEFAKTWAEPFRSLVLNTPKDTEFIDLDVKDLCPPLGLRSTGRVILAGDSMHSMSMYRGEGANHAIVDIQDFVKYIGRLLENECQADLASLRPALDNYEDAVITRTRHGVLASRQACLDAHDAPKITDKSPLLTRRSMFPEF